MLGCVSWVGTLDRHRSCVGEQMHAIGARRGRFIRYIRLAQVPSGRFSGHHSTRGGGHQHGPVQQDRQSFERIFGFEFFVFM